MESRWGPPMQAAAAGACERRRALVEKAKAGAGISWRCKGFLVVLCWVTVTVRVEVLLALIGALLNPHGPERAGRSAMNGYGHMGRPSQAFGSQPFCTKHGFDRSW
jgi:hypothetical protein